MHIAELNIGKLLLNFPLLTFGKCLVFRQRWHSQLKQAADVLLRANLPQGLARRLTT